MGWKEGFLQGLDHSKLIVLTVSVECLKSLKSSNDNVFLEWELAFKREQEGRAVVVPLFIEDQGTPLVLPDLNSYPDELHDNHESPREITLRSLASRIYERQGVHTTVIRKGDTVSIDKSAIAQIFRIHQQLVQATALLEFVPTLTRDTTEAIKRMLNVPDDIAVSFKKPSELQDVIALDVVDWATYVGSKILVIPSVIGLESVLRITLTQRNFYAAHINVGSLNTPINVICKITLDLARALPAYGRVLASVLDGFPAEWRLFSALDLVLPLLSIPLMLSNISDTLVILVNGECDGQDFELLKAFSDIFKIVFIGITPKYVLSVFDFNSVALYQLEEASTFKFMPAINSHARSSQPVSVVTVDETSNV
ncbi:UNVERIFIED_CONTAM: hypothetical protein HDU68_009457 [Siphonaria sp. JEL0065]|nr:hypothetical protein HDU68_009457 [Siphonaria sp. JEL0065]